jgi:hypothetical protein
VVESFVRTGSFRLPPGVSITCVELGLNKSSVVVQKFCHAGPYVTLSESYLGRARPY